MITLYKDENKNNKIKEATRVVSLIVLINKIPLL